MATQPQRRLSDSSITAFDETPHLRLITGPDPNYGLFEAFVRREFARAGLQINGRRAIDPQIHHPRVYRQLALHGSLGLGESYMAGDWTVRCLDLMIEQLFRSAAARHRWTPARVLRRLQALAMNLQSPARAKIVCEEHYDLDNDLFEAMLDERMVYTCGYWQAATTLDESQVAKLDLICRKLDLRPGMRLLDIGCGFGSLMKYAAETYGVECVGYSLSKEQVAYGEASCAGLPIRFVLDDYRRIKGQFDRVASIGMMEAVGPKNFATYMGVIDAALAPNGIALIHTVGHNVTTSVPDPWVDKYIFPNGVLPSIAQIGKAIEGRFVMEDWHNFGPDYARTLRAWNKNFQAAWPRLRGRYDERFKRMWEFYLLAFAGGFAARNWQLWQVVLTKKGREQPPCRVS